MTQEDTIIHLLAGQRSDGQLIFEPVLAKPIGDDCYQLLTSPAFARGAARQDTVRLLNAGRFAVETHGGNLCLRIFAKRDIEIVKQLLSEKLKAQGIQLDFGNERMLVFSIPVAAGFSVIEEHIQQALSPYGDDAYWLYANVYDTDGQTPLNWWHDFLAK